MTCCGCGQILAPAGRRFRRLRRANAIVGADNGIDDFRLVQTAANRLELCLTSAPAAEAAKAALERVLRAMGAKATIDVTILPVLEVSARKLRRVERRWQP